jgi:hypothetical protein
VPAVHQVPILSEWSSFYVMAGSSAAALTGLMFVVISLVQGREAPSSSDGISTFSTPTVMHFAAALLLSAVLIAPWQELFYPGIAAALIGLYGLVYIGRIASRTKRLRLYTADLEDWIWYIVAPFLAYGAILGGAIVFIITAPDKAAFAMAGGVVLLLFVGIRNAWDVVTFLAVTGSSPRDS